MTTTPDTLLALGARLRAGTAQVPALPAELWGRIESAHCRRVRRRRALGFGTVSALCLLSLAATAWLARSPTPNSRIDWQARAQALELQLRSLDRGGGAPVWASAAPIELELAQVDRSLQQEYERRAPTQATRLEALWRQRSELLDALIVARRQGLTLTQI